MHNYNLIKTLWSQKWDYSVLCLVISRHSSSPERTAFELFSMQEFQFDDYSYYSIGSLVRNLTVKNLKCEGIFYKINRIGGAQGGNNFCFVYLKPIMETWLKTASFKIDILQYLICEAKADNRIVNPRSLDIVTIATWSMILYLVNMWRRNSIARSLYPQFVSILSILRFYLLFLIQETSVPLSTMWTLRPPPRSGGGVINYP